MKPHPWAGKASMNINGVDVDYEEDVALWHCNSCNKDFNDWEHSNTTKCDLCGSTDITRVNQEKR